MSISDGDTSKQRKLPSFQFYPGDWLKDPGIRALDFYCRGVWFEMLCIMHESERRGVLLLNGKAMPIPALANILGIPLQKTRSTLAKLSEGGIYSVEAETGAIYSRRMVKDEVLRQARAEWGKEGAEHGAKGAEHGVKGGRPKKEKAEGESPANEHSESEVSPVKKPPFKPPFGPVIEPPLKPAPSSSSSSSSSNEMKPEEKNKVSPEPERPASGPPSELIPILMNFPCKGRGPGEWELTIEKAQEYQESFPGVDVIAECRKARQWCIDNSNKQKTHGGMPAFLSRWLSKCQDRSGTMPHAGGYQRAETFEEKALRHLGGMYSDQPGVTPQTVRYKPRETPSEIFARSAATMFDDIPKEQALDIIRGRPTQPKTNSPRGGIFGPEQLAKAIPPGKYRRPPDPVDSEPEESHGALDVIEGQFTDVTDAEA